LIEGRLSTTLRRHSNLDRTMNADATPKAASPARGKQVIWINVMTVFGAAFAGSWAIANLFGFDEVVRRVLDVAFLAIGAYIMFRFIQFARKVEPFSR
jgi:hypothetical protein